MYNTTGFTRAEIAELCTRIEARKLAPGMRIWPPILGLRNALTATLTYMRRNRIQAEIAEAYGVSQPTVSRAISAITPLLMNVLLDFVPTADELTPGRVTSWTARCCRAGPGSLTRNLYSGKHKTTGMNVQVVCTIDGRLAWISDPLPRSRHDNHCLGAGHLVCSTALHPQKWVGDKGYIGNNMITCIKKPAWWPNFLDWEKKFNKQVNQIRYRY